MENHILTVKDKMGNDLAVTVETGSDSSAAYIEYTDNHITKRTYTFQPSANTFHQVIIVKLMHEWKDEEGNILLNNEPTQYTRTDLEEYKYFFNMQISGVWGDLLNKHCLNGYLFDKFGVRCFDETGTFYQPELPEPPAPEGEV